MINQISSLPSTDTSVKQTVQKLIFPNNQNTLCTTFNKLSLLPLIIVQRKHVNNTFNLYIIIIIINIKGASHIKWARVC